MIITATLLAMITMSLPAQETTRKLGLELRPGASLATTKLGETELQPGFGFEFLLHYNFMQNAGVYGGWGWNRFAAETGDLEFEETGYVFGLRFAYPLTSAGTAVFARAGGIYNHIEVEEDGGELISDTGHGFGWQGELGIELPIGKGWLLRPGLKYQALNRDLELGNITTNVDHNYISLGVGIAKYF